MRKLWLLAGILFGVPCGAQPPLASLEDACRLISQRLASVPLPDCLDAGFTLADTASVQGQPILYRDVVPADPDANRVLLVGGIHGDELTSVSIVFRWLAQLRDERFQAFHWRVVPCLNPDGLLANPSARTNAHGVDLNRNFPTTNWRAEAIPYWTRVTHRDRRRYPGPLPLSEPESSWLAHQIEEFKPDAVVQIHAPLDRLDYDGPPEPPDRFGFLHLKLIGTYPGSLGNYAGLNLGLRVITIELPQAGIMPNALQQARLWTDMASWLHDNLPPRPQPPLYQRLAAESWWRRLAPEP